MAFQPTASGWHPGQQWTTHFDQRGFLAQPQAGGWSWGLELQSYGFGEKQTASGGASLHEALLHKNIWPLLMQCFAQRHRA
jgi:hypothetical protein